MLTLLLAFFFAIPTQASDIRLGQGIRNSKGERLVPFCVEFSPDGNGCNRIRVKYYAQGEVLDADRGNDFGVEFPGYYFDRVQYEKMVKSDPRVIPENKTVVFEPTYKFMTKTQWHRLAGSLVLVTNLFQIMVWSNDEAAFKTQIWPTSRWATLLLAPYVYLIAKDIALRGLPKWSDQISLDHRNRARARIMMQAYDQALKHSENWTVESSPIRVKNWIFEEWMIFLKSAHLKQQLPGLANTPLTEIK